MWACETLGGAGDSSVKQNWNLQKVPKAATEEPVDPPPPSLPELPVSWMHSPLREAELFWRGCDRTDGLLTDRGATDVGGSETGSRDGAGERQKAKGGYFSRMTGAVDELFRLLPPLTHHLFALVWYLFHPRKSAANPAQVPKRSWTHIFYVFSASFPVFLSDLISL